MFPIADMSDYLSKEEIDNIVSAFKDMDIKPSAQTPEDFKAWMEEYKDDEQWDAFLPRISTFTGDEKTGTPYDIWRYEVQCLIRTGYTHDTIKMAITRSLRGNSSKIPMRLGTDATIDDIMDKMDSIYGSVYPAEALLGQFYTARQNDDEDVASWGCRLEEILSQAKNRRNITDENINDMLTSKFFEGLRPELKNVARYKKDTTTDFQTLLRSLREIENEHNLKPVPKKKPSPLKQATTSTENKQIQQLTALVKQLSQEIRSLKNDRGIIEPTNIRWRQRDTPQRPDETIIHRPIAKKKRQRKHQSETICWRCRQPGHISAGCYVRLDHSRKTERSLNLQQAFVMEQTTDVEQNRTPGLLGSANEVTVTVNGNRTTALLDTGSTVSTISEGFYNQHLSQIPLQSLSYLLNIECADGQQLPYKGYVEADLQLHGSADTNTHPGLFLVIPDSEYHNHVPVLIGTSILAEVMKDVKKQHGQRFLQDAKLQTPYYLAFRCMTLRNKELERQHNRLALIKSAETRPITIQANTEVVVQGYMDKMLPYPTTVSMLHATSNSAIPNDLDIVPSVVTYDQDKPHTIPVHISNITTRTVTIAPKAVLCELQPVSVQQERVKPNDEVIGDIFKEINIPNDTLTADELIRGKNLIQKYNDIFSKSDTDIGYTSLVKHRIDLTDDTPFKQRHRRIPPSMLEEVRNHLQQLLSAGIIRRSHSPWSSNVVLVRKKDGKLRMCVDYRQLNQRTIKDSYALPRIDEILDSLGGNKIFTVLDMKSGYHQLDIEKDHKQRTAFTVGPLGFF